MYIIVRLVCGLGIILGSIAILKAKLSSGKRKIRFVIVIAFLLCVSGLIFVPIENAFVTFTTPESAFNYVTLNRTTEIECVDGRQSTLIVAKNDTLENCMILPKRNNTWKIDTGINTKTIYQGIFESYVIFVYQYKDTNEYYVSVLSTGSSIEKITDNRNTNFLSLFGDTNKYYGYTNDFSNDYYIVVNDEILILLA